MSPQRTPGFERSPVWQPTEAYRARSALLAFLERHQLRSVTELDQRARREPGWFWSAAWEALELEWFTRPSATHQGTDPRTTVWFPDGRVNLADNAVERWLRRG